MEEQETFKWALCRLPSFQRLMFPSFITLNLCLNDLKIKALIKTIIQEDPTSVTTKTR